MSKSRRSNGLDIYIRKNVRFKSFIFDHKEVRCIANTLGLAPDYVRIELRKLGYSLIKINGRLVWKRVKRSHFHHLLN
jgi:hypothetical protein